VTVVCAPLIAGAEAEGLVPVLSVPRLSGHPYSGGYDSKEIADRLKQVFPVARVLIVIREQRSIVLSVYKQFVKAGGPAGPQAFLFPATKRGWRVPGFDYRHFAYDRLIAYYQSLFGRENVLVLLYEDFVADGRSFVQAIAQFADRTVRDEVLDGMPFTRRSNEASSALMIELSRPLNRFDRRSDVNPTPLFHSRAVSRFARHVRASSPTAPGARSLATREETKLRRLVDEAVGDRYVESNRRTTELTGLDLAAAGWTL